MKILYISALVSEKRVNDEFCRTGRNPGFAVQKFSRMLVKGLITNGADVLALSKNINGNPKRMILNSVKEISNGVNYQYIPIVNIPIIKQVCLFLYTFFYTLFWGMRNKHQKAIICDVLSISTSMGALIASKINQVQSVAIVTDIFSLMAKKNARTQTLKVKIASKVNSLYCKSFSKYILLTEQMNEMVNSRHRPYIVMEALCDPSIINKDPDRTSKAYPRTVLYAGGINEIYGLKMLAEGFVKADVTDTILVYYGSGPFVEEYKKLCELHPNLKYRGVVTTEEIEKAEQEATLLVNPRFSTEEYTKYSFPSKNMEYMASGTPVLTTRLPGMPKEYYPYVFLFEEETVEGYANEIRRILSLSEEELRAFGKYARRFVLSKKNNNMQANRLLNFLSAR